VWTAVATGCLLLATAVALVSGTVDGLNVFGWRLADTTPSFPDAPKDRDAKDPKDRDANKDLNKEPTRKDDGARRPQRPGSLMAAPSSMATPAPALTGVGSSSPDAPVLKTAAAGPPAPKACARPGFAAVLDPASEPIGTALARSLAASDLQTRIITLSDASGANSGAAKDGLGREDVDHIMAGDGSSVTGRIKEGTLLVAQLKVQIRQTVIAESPMTEVLGTMDLAIVRNLCGTITVQRHSAVDGRSVNETLDDGIRGLGEIFKEKIADLVGRGLGASPRRTP